MSPTVSPVLCLEANLSGGTGRDDLHRTCLALNIAGKKNYKPSRRKYTIES